MNPGGSTGNQTMHSVDPDPPFRNSQPPRFAEIILLFALVFVQQRTWHHAKLLLLGALPTPGQLTVCSILRIFGLRRERHFVNYHHVLNRAVWHSQLGARLLPERLLRAFALYDPAPPHEAGTKGLPRKKGARLPALSAVLADARTV